jgi:hypothetical protein
MLIFITNKSRNAIQRGPNVTSCGARSFAPFAYDLRMTHATDARWTPMSRECCANVTQMSVTHEIRAGANRTRMVRAPRAE